MSQRIEILNGDDRPHALKTLKRAISGAKGAARTHLAAVLRSLNPHAARSRAFSKGASMSKPKKAAPRKGHHHKTRKHNPTEGTYSLRSVGTKAKAKVSHAARRAVGHFKGLDVMGIIKDGVGIGLGLIGTDLVAKQVIERFAPASLPAIAKSFAASAVVAGGSIALGGGKGFAREVAKGAIAGFLHSAAKTFLPAGLMAGTDDVVSGRWDENGQWIPDASIAGLVYDPGYAIPASSERPDGM